MKSNDNNSLIIIKETIFDKIKKLFVRNKIEKAQTNNNYENVEQSNFLNEIKLKNNKDSSLEELQYLIRNNQIKEEELTEKQREDLRNLYKSQISELKNSIQMYKHKISKLKNKNVKKVFD